MARSKASSPNVAITFIKVETPDGAIRAVGREGGHWTITAPWDEWSYSGWETEVRAFIDRKILAHQDTRLSLQS